jgi:hypothetical protein
VRREGSGVGSAPARQASYVLPLRCSPDHAAHDGLARYLAGLPAWLEVLVVDGSEEAEFRCHGSVFAGSKGRLRHMRPDEDIDCANGKVAGVTTGVRHASHEPVVIADDDVRYANSVLEEIVTCLRAAEEIDLVVPQNYFEPLPWHAAWDTGRILVNRAFGMDYPGTLAVRRSAFLDGGGYDGDVLFENLELIRTFRVAGRRVVVRADLFVRRLPPSTRQFFSQRVRQAYDDFGQPLRLTIELTLLPLATAAARRGRGRPFLVVAGAIVAAAELGRRRRGGRNVFPARCSLMAPAWALERAVCVWVAVGARLRGGVRYRGRRIARAATPARHLRRRLSPATVGLRAREG